MGEQDVADQQGAFAMPMRYALRDRAALRVRCAGRGHRLSGATAFSFPDVFPARSPVAVQSLGPCWEDALLQLLRSPLPTRLPSTVPNDCTVIGASPAGSRLQGFPQGVSHRVFPAMLPLTAQSLGSVLGKPCFVNRNRAKPAVRRFFPATADAIEPSTRLP